MSLNLLMCAKIGERFDLNNKKERFSSIKIDIKSFFKMRESNLFLLIMKKKRKEKILFLLSMLKMKKIRFFSD